MTLELNYQVDISEGFGENGDFLIEGTAINATTTGNGHTFLVEELRPAANGLTGVPLLEDHRNEVSAIKGRVISGTFNEAAQKIDFKAKVVDEKCKKMIKQGLLNSVSVGAMAGSVEESDDGSIIVRDIQFKELSLVAVPADGGATFATAIQQALKSDLKQMKGGMTRNMDKKVKEEAPINSEEEVKEDEVKSEEESKPEEESKEEEKSESEEESKEGAETQDALKIILDRMDKLDAKIDALEAKEADADEAKEEEEDTEEAEEANAEPEEDVEESQYKFIEGHGSLRGQSVSYHW